MKSGEKLFNYVLKRGYKDAGISINLQLSMNYYCKKKIKTHKAVLIFLTL